MASILYCYFSSERDLDVCPKSVEEENKHSLDMSDIAHHHQEPGASGYGLVNWNESTVCVRGHRSGWKLQT